MKPQAKNSVNFTFILPAFLHKTSDFPLYQNLGAGALIFLNQAQYFQFAWACWLLRYLEHITSSNIPMPGLLTQNKVILTLPKKTWNMSRMHTVRHKMKILTGFHCFLNISQFCFDIMEYAVVAVKLFKRRTKITCRKVKMIQPFTINLFIKVNTNY